ncbi:EAL domain-containing protein [Serpentinicella alkaliphila]|nr:EAL domain-containing protein [Serpentinicella alkaliphila]
MLENNRADIFERNKLKDELIVVKSNLESIITSRITTVNGIIAFAEINKNFTQEQYESFAEGIYYSVNDVVKNVSYISDTTITHIYPYEEYKHAIGWDLSEVPEQLPSILYAKNRGKSVLSAPVDLVQGGTGMIIRVPVIVSSGYLGQVSIVFDYDKVLTYSGIEKLSNNNYLELFIYDVVNGGKKTIWSNVDRNLNYRIYETVNLYESEIYMSIAPKRGWGVKTILEYMLLIVGFIASLLTYLALRKLYENKETLYLMNIHLEHTIDQLTASQKQLKNKLNEVKLKEKHIQFLADHDSLTGLYNRRKFIELLEDKLESESEGTILLVDIDDFKNINDSMGHIYGDNVLQYFSSQLQSDLPNFARAYRIGGDEFIIIFDNIVTKREITPCIELVVECFNNIDAINNQISLSIGVVFFPEHGATVEDLLIKVDIAMYSAKNSGKNKFSIFDESMLFEFNEKIRIEQLIRSALDNEWFFIEYQPIIDKSTGETSSFEALIRMSEPKLMPNQFISIAERTGLIIQIGRWVIKEVIEQLKNWKINGYNLKPIAVNLSPKQIYDGNLVEFLESQLKINNIDPSLIEIEITENVLIENGDSNIVTLQRIKDLGITISLDDFGTNYSSLNYLTYMPVDKIKIDKNFKDKFINFKNNQFLEGIVFLAHTLNLKVVIEGVEDEDEYSILKKGESDFLQGYLFSRPLKKEDATKFLTKN